MYVSIQGSGAAVVSDEPIVCSRKRPSSARQRRDDPEEGPVVARADVLEHPEGDDRVEPPRELAVVLEADLDREAADPLPRRLHLLLRDRDAGDLDAVALGGEAREAAPAAADVEDPLPGFSPTFRQTRSSFRSWASSRVAASFQ